VHHKIANSSQSHIDQLSCLSQSGLLLLLGSLYSSGWKISYQNNDFDSYLSSSVLASHRWHKPMAFNHAKIIKCAIRL